MNGHLLSAAIALALLSAQPLLPNGTQQIKSPVTSVVVHLNCAQVTHSPKVKVRTGLNRVLFTGLAMNIVPGHVSLRGFGNAELLSLTLHRLSDTSDLSKPDESLQALLGKHIDSLRFIERSLKKLGYEIAGLRLERLMLEKNDDIIPNGKMTSLPEFRDATAYYRTRYAESAVELEQKMGEWNAMRKRKIRILKTAFGAENEAWEGLTFCVVAVTLNNPGVEYSAEPSLVYLAKHSGWIPQYEIHSEDNKSFKIIYRAKILNNTGLDWNGPALTLSTADPTEYYTAPHLEPFYVGRYDFKSKYDYDEDEEEDDKKNKDKNKSAAADEEEILIPDHEIAFKITKSYTIRAGLVPVFVDVTTYELNPEYIYRCAPVKEQKVYSIARIREWEKLNMVDGEANIYNNGMYLGKTYIRPADFEDFIEIPLGVVEHVYVKYRLAREYSSKKFLGGDIVATRNFEIRLKNTGSEKITVEVIDQVPVPAESSVKTDNVEYTEGGEKDGLTGQITWRTELSPSSEKAFLLKYSVTYPRRKGYRAFANYKRRKTRSKF